MPRIRVLKFVRFTAIYIVVFIALNVIIYLISPLFIGRGSDKVGDYMIALLLGFWVSLITAIPLAMLINRAINRLRE